MGLDNKGMLTPSSPPDRQKFNFDFYTSIYLKWKVLDSIINNARILTPSMGTVDFRLTVKGKKFSLSTFKFLTQNCYGLK